MLFLKTRPRVERILVSDEIFHKIAAMRYRVYCEEMGFLEKDKYPKKLETDEYDGGSIHIAVLIGKRLAGYARVILPRDGTLPIFDHFEIPPEHHMETACEVSRFMISKLYRQRTETRREIFRLLTEELLKVVREHKLESIYAVVEDWLLKSLRKRGYMFEMIGEGKDHMGAITYPTKVGL